MKKFIRKIVSGTIMLSLATPLSAYSADQEVLQKIDALTKELEALKQQVKESNNKIKENEERNEQARQELMTNHNVANPSRDDIIKYKLWLECNKTCPYTGKTISPSALFGPYPEFQIEHIGQRTHQHRLAVLNALRTASAFRHQRVQAGRAFRRRSARVVEEPRASRALPLAVPFRRVQQRGKAGTVELIANLGEATALRLDEVPQLVNVLLGHMSLVGPRPLPMRDVSRFDEPWFMRRFSVRPGLTCLWQISGRSTVGFDDWMALDLEYIDRWSLRLDLRILARTLPAVFAETGAS